MPWCWSRTPDFVGKIWCGLWRRRRGEVLRWSETEAPCSLPGISVNKPKVCLLSLSCIVTLLVFLPPAGRGGEGWGEVSRCGCDSGGGRGLFLPVLQRGTWELPMSCEAKPLWRGWMCAASLAGIRGNKRFRPRCSDFDVCDFDLAGRGGEEGEGDGGDVVCMCGLVLPRRASSSVALFATGIFGRDGPIPRLGGASSTSRWEAFLRLSSGSLRLIQAKWFVPGGTEAAGGVSPAAVEGSKDLIAFLARLLGSSLHICRSFLQFTECKGSACILYPLFGI
jgi:hypothetical protein